MRPQTWVLLVLVLVAAVGVGGLWFVTVYDTAAGRCSRGDLGACSYLAAQQAAQGAAAKAAGDAALALRQDQALAAEPARELAGLCYLRLDGHDATLRFAGDGAYATCTALAGMSIGGQTAWNIVVRAVGAEGAPVLVCAMPYGGFTGSELTLTVLDSGGAYYGGLVCRDLAGSRD